LTVQENLKDSFATKKAQKSPRTIEITGALMIGGERGIDS